MDDVRLELAVASGVLAAHDERREVLSGRRDAALVAAQEAGVKWGELSELSGLAPGALSAALKRGRAAQKS